MGKGVPLLFRAYPILFIFSSYYFSPIMDLGRPPIFG